MDNTFLRIFLILVLLGLVAAIVYVKFSTRAGRYERPDRAERPSSRATTTVAEPEEDYEEEYVDDVDERRSSAWVEEIAVPDDDALAELDREFAEEADLLVEDDLVIVADDDGDVLIAEELTVVEVEPDEVVDEVEVEVEEDYDPATVDEEFESITAGFEEEIIEDVRSDDDIMAASRATEINPAGNSELQRLLQKVQMRLNEYD